ncbi:LAFE_0C13850g1_1 [Lachancea fermentati]|uniref:PAN2-PAN3 deadenylation complex subunit PAN3 n=1 Tax=Lachancea fermentati TaxID=4955 RepID=A0A1G4MAK2_LACFM|nr:LAFE_0C13850g1_1 [Lachancea fermentati]
MDKANSEWAKDIPCKNITIYGFCKYENDGCIFNHGAKKQAVPNAPVAKFNAKTASTFTPLKSVTSESSLHLGSTDNLSVGHSPLVTEAHTVTAGSLKASANTPSYNPYAAHFTPSASAGSANSTSSGNNFNPYSTPVPLSGTPEVSAQAASTTSFVQNTPAQFALNTNRSAYNFPTIYPPSHSILQYHLYAPDPPLHLKVPLKPNERTPESLFIPNNLREELLKRNQSLLQVFPAGGNLPEIVGDYFGLVPLEFHNRVSHRDSYRGHQNSIYKVFSNFDGKIYIMRRIHDVKVTDPVQISKPYQLWQNVSCSNVVKLKDAFITGSFGDSSLCVVHEFFPLSSSLYEGHFVSFNLSPITQDVLWSYLVQLCNAIQEVHSIGLALNNLCLDKVIITGNPGRIKVGDCCVFDILHFQEDLDLVQQQQQDFFDLGTVLCELAMKMTGSADENIEALAIDDDFKDVLRYLLDKKNIKTLKELMSLFSHKVLSLISSFQTFSEYAESILAKELENSRLFRLMCKLNFIFGRLESRVDINWSESGDKFPIILFYDYVFHQVDETGKPIMDLTHVLRCLNKLDAGVAEKIMLVTPDEMNCIIISYKELKDLIDSTFRSMVH